ncbi:MAG TPA: hypothetical protein VKP88_06355 [Candidatus Paceibacterota bacterium]|nr:hypothetical protein [Candidatus Paceibacterota bacterium]HMA78720.1 hypothetical protein [Candidatus Paceibacterota bacterium]
MSKVGAAISKILEDGTASVSPYPAYAEPETFDNTNEEYVTYRVRSIEPSDTKQGPSLLDHVEVDILIFGKSYLSAVSLSDKVRTDLDRVAYGTYNGVELNGVQFLSIDEDYDPITERHEIEQSYRIRVKNP